MMPSQSTPDSAPDAPPPGRTSTRNARSANWDDAKTRIKISSDNIAMPSNRGNTRNISIKQKWKSSRNSMVEAVSKGNVAIVKAMNSKLMLKLGSLHWCFFWKQAYGSDGKRTKSENDRIFYHMWLSNATGVEEHGVHSCSICKCLATPANEN